MEEDESFDELYAKLKDIVNSVSNLGETHSFVYYSGCDVILTDGTS